jgi:hypothetical protein
MAKKEALNLAPKTVQAKDKNFVLKANLYVGHLPVVHE